MNDATPLKAGILGRVSRDKSREARSVVQQQDDNRKACAEHGWVIPPGGEYQDIGSASRFATKAREDWSRLLADLEAGHLNVVVMWEPSRGSRRLSEWALFLDTCRDHHVLVHVTDHSRTYDLDNPRDWRSLAEDGVDSAYESEKTQRRIKRDMKAAGGAGRPHGRVQYGYERIYNEKTRRLIEQRAVQPQAGIVAEIIRRIASREPLSAIRNDLNTRGVKSPAGGQWTAASMRRITRCPVYIGKRPSGGVRQANGRYVGTQLELVPAIWPAIVTEDVWLEAQEVLNDPARSTTRPGRYKWLLSRIATCEPCGAPLTVHYAPRKTTAPVPLYECSGPHHCLGIVAEVVDRHVSERIIAYLSRPDVYPALNRDESVEAGRARAEVAKLRAELDEWAAADITARAYKIREAKQLPKIEAAERRVRALTVPLPLRDLASPEGDVRARWEAMPVAVRREVVKALNLSVEVVKAGRADGSWLPGESRVKVRMKRR